MSAQIVVKQVRVVKALPDEIFSLIKEWLLPVKPKECAACKTPCVKPHLMKALDTTHSSIKRGNYCNTCWCSRLIYPSFDKIKDHFTEELTKNLYPTDTVIKSELKKRSNKIAGEWRLITKGKWLFDTHKLRKTQEKAMFYERLLNKGIQLHVSEMVRKVNRTKDLANAPMRKEILSKALAKRFSEGRVSYEYFTAVLREISWHLYGESEMISVLEKWAQIDNIKHLTNIKGTNGIKRWRTNQEGVLMFDIKVIKQNNCFEFCGYWNSTTRKLEYKC
jgi:hypothetical protein